MERRKFTRILFDADVNLQIEGKPIASTLLDISLNGALVEANNKPDAIPNTSTGELVVNLNDGATHIQMEVCVSHIEENRLGLQCESIDIDSATHLRRLVELNVGDPAILDRELTALGSPDD